MKTLLNKTTAYKILCSDVQSKKVNHAYFVHCSDESNLRDILKLFAVKLFCAENGSITERLILKESFTDCKVFPEVGKKYDVEMAEFITDDSLVKPAESHIKVYILSSFEQASEKVQNKLLKVLEEPPESVYFLIGAVSLAPVLPTIKSRVKMLTIPPFSFEDILGVIQQKYPNNPDCINVAKSCGGVLGVAENMLKGTWYTEVRKMAFEICMADTPVQAYELSQAYADTPYKAELLREISCYYFAVLAAYAGGNLANEEEQIKNLCCKPVLVFAQEAVTKAAKELKFNGYFPSLLYNLMLKIIEENNRWKKLSE